MMKGKRLRLRLAVSMPVAGIGLWYLIITPSFFLDILPVVDAAMVLWIASGVIALFAVMVKIDFFIRILMRSRNPAFYRNNYFGKKVYNEGIMNKSEFLIMKLTIPFFLIFGAYFVAVLINMLISRG